MKSIVLALVLTLVSALALPIHQAQASGKISGQVNYYTREEKVAPAFGLSIYEPLFLGLAYNGWTGVGSRPHFYDDSVTWFVTKHALETWIDDIGFSMGYQAEYNTNEGPVQHSANFKVSLKLW
jgi:hypothetical protein